MANPLANTKDKDKEWDIEPCKVTVQDTEDVETRMAILNGSATEEQVTALREKQRKRSKGLSVLIDESNSQTATTITQNVQKMANTLLRPDVMKGIAENIKTPKDYESIAKGMSMLNDLAHRQMTRSTDIDEAKKGMKGVKIGIAFGDGTVVTAGMGDDNG